MRKSYSNQLRLDCLPIEQVSLNLECRDEIVPVLAGLQHLYLQIELRDQVTRLIAADVNETTRVDVGREGLSYWKILVLGIVRLGCNLNYDKPQDLCENHRALRGILNVGDWDETSFRWQRIRDTLCLLNPSTLEKINELIVSHGQQLHGDARKQVRADSFVCETNIHYPTESSLIWDGVRKLLPVCRKLGASLGLEDWRQTSHHLKTVKRQVREIARLSASKSPRVKLGVYPAYGVLLNHVGVLPDRVRTLKKAVSEAKLNNHQKKLFKQVIRWYEPTSTVVDTAFRRTQLRETVPNEDKIFSVFETHTQLYRRGKAGEPNQFGRCTGPNVGSQEPPFRNRIGNRCIPKRQRNEALSRSNGTRTSALSRTGSHGAKCSRVRKTADSPSQRKVRGRAIQTKNSSLSFASQFISQNNESYRYAPKQALNNKLLETPAKSALTPLPHQILHQLQQQIEQAIMYEIDLPTDARCGKRF